MKAGRGKVRRRGGAGSYARPKAGKRANKRAERFRDYEREARDAERRRGEDQ